MLLIALIAFLAGMAGVYVRLRREFPRSITLTALVLLAGATPLAWYSLFEPSPLDVAAFALIAWLGVAARAGERAPRLLRIAAWVGLCALPVGIVAWTAVGGEPFRPLQSRWLDVLFSSWHGFLSWTPVVYVAVLGTLIYARRDPGWSVVALVVLLATAWVLGASESWLRESAVGARPLISVLAVLAPGLACLLDAMRTRPVIALVPIVLTAIAWNYFLMVQYTVGLLPKDEPVSFARLVQQQADLQARTSPLYPFAFPANVWFAWREGLPVDRYDVLALEPRQASVDLVLDRNAERFLLEGWDAPTAEGEEPGWWSGGREATIAVPLAPTSREGTVRLTIRARSRFEEPTVQADLSVLVNGHEVGQFSPAATNPRDAHFSMPATALRDGFNKVSIVSRGAHRVDPSDVRPPGPIARRSGQPWPVAVYRLTIAPM